jgi:hypothetical protein
MKFVWYIVHSRDQMEAPFISLIQWMSSEQECRDRFPVQAVLNHFVTRLMRAVTVYAFANRRPSSLLPKGRAISARLVDGDCGLRPVFQKGPSSARLEILGKGQFE